MSSISSSAVEGALLVRMRRTERELREIEGEVQRWKETLSRGTRSESRVATELSNAGFDELPGLCAEALQAAMQLRRRAETVRRSMTYIRSTASEQSAARMGLTAANSLPGGAAQGGMSFASSGNASSFLTSPSQSINNNNSNMNNLQRNVGSPAAPKTFQAGGSSALAYFVEDFVNSEFSMQEQAWWDVMSDIEGVEALAVSLLSVPSSEVNEQRIRQASSMHQSRPAEWTVENWDASITASIGMPAVMMGDGNFSETASPSSPNRRQQHFPSAMNAAQHFKGSPLAPSSHMASFVATPISDLLLRRLQEQNRAKGLYTTATSSSSSIGDFNHNGNSNNHNNSRSHSGNGGGNGGGADYDRLLQQQTSAHVGPIFASLAANPEVMSASDFDRLPKSDPLALFMSQMGAQLEEEQKRLKQLAGGVSDPFRFGSFMNSNNNNTNYRDPLLSSNEPSFLQVRPGGDVYSPEKMGADYRQRQRDEEEKLREIERDSTEALMKKKKEEAAARDAEELVLLEEERKREQARKAAQEAEQKKKLDEEKAVKAAERKKREDEAVLEEAAMKKKEEEIAKQIKDQEAKAAAAEKLRALELAEEEAAQARKEENPQLKQEESEKQGKAATRIQAAHRGSIVRRNLKDSPARALPAAGTEDVAPVVAADADGKKKKKEEAVVKTQEPLPTSTPAAEPQNDDSAAVGEDGNKLSEAALKIQTAQRGNAARRELQRRRAESIVVTNNNDDDDNNKQGAAAAVSSSSINDNKKEGDGEKSDIEKQVEAALVSGEWKQVKDAKGRAYFYHPASKKTTWDLGKELAKKCKH